MVERVPQSKARFAQAHEILIAEDDPVVAIFLQFLLDDLGLSVQGPCATVAGGLDLISEGLPAAAILDVSLADCEVFELADRLYEAKVPIMFHSAHADSEMLLRRYPGAAICPKPAMNRDIEATLINWFEQDLPAQG